MIVLIISLIVMNLFVASVNTMNSTGKIKNIRLVEIAFATEMFLINRKMRVFVLISILILHLFK